LPVPDARKPATAFQCTAFVGITWRRTKGDSMYIGGGFLALILIILLLIWLF
jgi:hypothetical protein